MHLANSAGHLSAVFLAVGIVAGAIALEARGVGFDCSKALIADEKVVCGDPGLSSFNDELSAIYSRALSSAANPDAVKADQRRWLTQVRNERPISNALKRLIA